MTAYYNEIEPYAAEWLRNLIAAGHIAPGDVDERDIRDVKPDDLKGYTQCHFFAGIGVWSYALRLAGWPDDRPVWTGSCPCQPFSTAGRGKGTADDRHLWPAWQWLIDKSRPADVLGEQVASKDGRAWIDIVLSQMEGLDYAGGAIDCGSAGVGAPHIRQRLFWAACGVANAEMLGHLGGEVGNKDAPERKAARARQDEGLRLAGFASTSGNGGVGDADGVRRARVCRGREEGTPEPSEVGGPADAEREQRQWRRAGQEVFEPGAQQRTERLRDAVGVDNSVSGRHEYAQEEIRTGRVSAQLSSDISKLGNEGRPGPTNGFWADADWLFCRDGKWRPVEPGTFPLVNGASSRVGRLRAYGNAINAEQTAIFIQSYLEARDDYHGYGLLG